MMHPLPQQVYTLPCPCRVPILPPAPRTLLGEMGPQTPGRCPFSEQFQEYPRAPHGPCLALARLYVSGEGRLITAQELSPKVGTTPARGLGYSGSPVSRAFMDHSSRGNQGCQAGDL